MPIINTQALQGAASFAASVGKPSKLELLLGKIGNTIDKVKSGKDALANASASSSTLEPFDLGKYVKLPSVTVETDNSVNKSIKTLGIILIIVALIFGILKPVTNALTNRRSRNRLAR